MLQKKLSIKIVELPIVEATLPTSFPTKHEIFAIFSSDCIAWTKAIWQAFDKKSTSENLKIKNFQVFNLKFRLLKKVHGK